MLWHAIWLWLSIAPSPQSELDAARALCRTGRPAEAAARLERWCEAAVQDVRRPLAAAELLLQHGQPVLAEAFARSAAGRAAGAVDGLSLWGTSLLLQRRLAAAEVRFREGVQRFPEQSQLWFQWGVALAELNNFRQAAAAFDEALKRRPEDPIYHFWAGDNHARLSQWERAERHLRLAVASPANPDAAWKLAEILAHRGRHEEAEQWFQQALLRDRPGQPRGRFHHAVFLYEQGRYREAAAALEQVTEEWPEHRVAWHFLARTWHRLGEPGPANEARRRYRLLQSEEDALEEAEILRRIRSLLQAR